MPALSGNCKLTYLACASNTMSALGLEAASYVAVWRGRMIRFTSKPLHA